MTNKAKFIYHSLLSDCNYLANKELVTLADNALGYAGHVTRELNAIGTKESADIARRINDIVRHSVYSGNHTEEEVSALEILLREQVGNYRPVVPSVVTKNLDAIVEFFDTGDDNFESEVPFLWTFAEGNPDASKVDFVVGDNEFSLTVSEIGIISLELSEGNLFFLHDEDRDIYSGTGYLSALNSLCGNVSKPSEDNIFDDTEYIQSLVSQIIENSKN